MIIVVGASLGEGWREAALLEPLAFCGVCSSALESGASLTLQLHTHTEVCERLWVRLVIGALVTDAEDQRSKPGALLQKG